MDACTKILTFFSKLSAGTGEQMLTRQMARLGNELALDSASASRTALAVVTYSSFGHDRSKVGTFSKRSRIYLSSWQHLCLLEHAGTNEQLCHAPFARLHC